MKETLYAIVVVRGMAKTTIEIINTLKMLNLTRVNHCSVMKKTKSLDGMLAKVSSNVTWGEVNAEVIEKMVLKRGRMAGEKKIDAKQAKEDTKKILDGEKPSIKPVFRLHPPSGGYRSVRMQFPKGDLGYRGDKINVLLNRMI